MCPPAQQRPVGHPCWGKCLHGSLSYLFSSWRVAFWLKCVSLDRFVMQISFFVFFHLLQPKSTGQDVFNRVAELLGIKELHFFGLTMVKGEPTASLRPTPPPTPPSLSFYGEGPPLVWKCHLSSPKCSSLACPNGVIHFSTSFAPFVPLLFLRPNTLKCLSGPLWLPT